MRELKGAGYEADNVWLLYRDPTGTATTSSPEVIIDKQRNGPEDTVVVGFDRPTMRFYDLEDGRTRRPTYTQTDADVGSAGQRFPNRL
jgi:hypothetical protein